MQKYFCTQQKIFKGQGRNILSVSKHLNNNFYLLCTIFKYFHGNLNLDKDVKKKFYTFRKMHCFYHFNAFYAYLEPKKQI